MSTRIVSPCRHFYEWLSCLLPSSRDPMQSSYPRLVFIFPLCFKRNISGRLPLLKIQKTLISGFNDIVDFVSKKGVSLSAYLTEAQTAEMKAHMSLVDHLLRNIELFVVWSHDETYSNVTRYRYGAVYHWPIRKVLPFFKRQEMLTYLQDHNFGGKVSFTLFSFSYVFFVEHGRNSGTM